MRAAMFLAQVDCIGCHKRVCPLGHHKCMEDLSVDVVYAEVVNLLNEDRSSRAA